MTANTNIHTRHPEIAYQHQLAQMSTGFVGTFVTQHEYCACPESYLVSLHSFNTMPPGGSSSFADAQRGRTLRQMAASLNKLQRNCSLSTTCLAASPWSSKWVCKNSSCGTVTHLLCLLCAAAALPCRADERHTVPTELKCVYFLHL